MSHTVIIMPEAERNLQEIGDYIAEEAPETALRWVNGILDKIETLSTFPEGHPFAVENASHERELRQMRHGRYRIIYFVTPEEVKVVSIRHSSRLPHPPGELDDIGT